MVGLVTLVIILVGSVTSTCLRSSFGDMRTYSAPILPISSGGWPGHSSTTRGLSATAFFSSAAATDQATHTQEMNEILASRFMVLLSYKRWLGPPACLRGPAGCGEGRFRRL